jgi:hypothetical protein
MRLEPQMITGICFRDTIQVAVTQFQILMRIDVRWKTLQFCADSSVGFLHTALKIKTVNLLIVLHLNLEYVSRD